MINLSEQIADAEREWLDLWQRGPTRTRWTRIPVQVGDPAPNLELLDFDGQSRRLSGFWEDRKSVV